MPIPDEPSVSRSRGASTNPRLSWRRILLGVFMLGAALLAVRAVLGSDAELGAAAHDLVSVTPGWVVAAVLAETGSYLSYAIGQRRLLRAGGADPPILALTALTLSAQAIANILPAGLAFSNVFNYRQLRRHHIPEVLAAWTLVATAIVYTAALGVLALIGTQLAGADQAVPNLLPFALPLVSVLVLLVIFNARAKGTRSRYRPPREPIVERLIARWPRLLPLLGRARGWEGWRERLGTITVGPGGWATAGAWLTAAWLTDAACLYLAFFAIRSPVPAQGLLLAYCAGQLAALLPITPGGLGVVEGSLTLALVAYGGGQSATLAAVLLYRLISYWAILPLGGAAYLWLRFSTARSWAHGGRGRLVQTPGDTRSSASFAAGGAELPPRPGEWQ